MRGQHRSAYCITSEGLERDQIAHGINWLGWSLTMHQAHEAWIVTPAHISLRDAFQEALGEVIVTALLARTDLAIQGLPLRCFTDDILPYTSPKITLLAAYPTKKMLDRLDNLTNIVSLAIVAANAEVSETWVSKAQAVTYPTPNERNKDSAD